MSVVPLLQQPACSRERAALLEDPDPRVASLLHPCSGCGGLTTLSQYCMRCAEEVASLQQYAYSHPVPTPVWHRPTWKHLLSHLVALLLLAAFFWLCAAV